VRVFTLAVHSPKIILKEQLRHPHQRLLCVLLCAKLIYISHTNCIRVSLLLRRRDRRIFSINIQLAALLKFVNNLYSPIRLS